MVERANTSEKANFDPQVMARLETSFYWELSEGNKERAHENHVQMYMEQWKMPEHIAIVADAYFAKGMIEGHYALIKKYSSLDFIPGDVENSLVDAYHKASKKNPIPISQTSKLFGLIYGIDPQDETLQEAMDLRGSGFRLLYEKGKKMGDEDWEHFESYMNDYYRYLKMATDH